MMKNPLKIVNMKENEQEILKPIKQQLDDPDFLDVFDYCKWDNLVKLENILLEEIDEWVKTHYTVKTKLTSSKNNE